MKKVLITLTIFFLIFFLNMCIRYIPENYYILVSDNQVSEEEAHKLMVEQTQKILRNCVKFDCGKIFSYIVLIQTESE